ncbi:MAG: tetratricopeptide repeat protein, partial [Gammaproteobacteria bacterium]|nr:tetratricopeptide repeat protein [Gammaproteobacteria bacterium]
AADLEPRNVQYQYQAAFDLQATGRVRESLPYLQRVTAKYPDHRDALFLEGYALQTAGDWTNAEARYRRFLAANADHVQARFNLAHGLMEAGAHDEAIEQFLDVLRRDPGRSSTHY